MSLSDTDLRHFVIELLTGPTARDLQTTIGASNLANGCDYCLACAFKGISRDTPITDRAWGGKTVGTAIHTHLEQRMRAHLDTLIDGLDPQQRRDVARSISAIAQRFPDALVEYPMHLGVIPGYGPVGSTADLVLPSEELAVDYKGSTRAKMAILADFLAIQRGEPAPYGRKHKVHKEKTLSETAYAEALADVEYKVSGYYMQLQTYAGGLNRMGIKISKISIVFITRDATMWFDNPASDRYDDPTAEHGVTVLSFGYDPDYADQVWQRGVSIWEGLESGLDVSDYRRNPRCFPCGLDGGGETAVPAALPPIAAPAIEQIVVATIEPEITPAYTEPVPAGHYAPLYAA